MNNQKTIQPGTALRQELASFGLGMRPRERESEIAIKSSGNEVVITNGNEEVFSQGGPGPWIPYTPEHRTPA